MKKVINTTKINTVEFIKGRKGKFRTIVKTQSGMLTCVDVDPRYNEYYSNNPSAVLGSYKKGALQTVEFKAEDSNVWLNVFARNGKKVIMIDEDMLLGLEVGVINQLYFNTNLYSQEQYKAVNAKTWASKAFVMNEEVAV